MNNLHDAHNALFLTRERLSAMGAVLHSISEEVPDLPDLPHVDGLFILLQEAIERTQSEIEQAISAIERCEVDTPSEFTFHSGSGHAAAVKCFE